MRGIGLYAGNVVRTELAHGIRMNVAGTSLEPLLIWKPNHSLKDALDFASSTAATLARLGSGAMVAHVGKRPDRRLELYETEGDPFSRRVREALSILDLDVTVHPCPAGGTRFRSKVETLLGGSLRIPLLVDANVDQHFVGADDIVKHLFASYGDGKVPLTLRAPLAMVGSRLATSFRAGKGLRASESQEPSELLELYGYEASPYCRVVRETLSRLEIPYVLHNLARGSVKRPAFIERAGKMQVPYLVDATHEVGMFESKDIVRHLEARYGKAPTPRAA